MEYFKTREYTKAGLFSKPSIIHLYHHEANSIGCIQLSSARFFIINLRGFPQQAKYCARFSF